MKVQILLLIIVVVVSNLAFAQNEDELKIGINVETSVVNKYVWRGLALTNGPSWQSSATLTMGGLSFNTWATMDLDDVNGHEYEFTEVDFSGDFAYDFEMLTINVGAIQYAFPNTDFDPTMEIYLGAIFNVEFSPSVTLYKDIDLVEGMYLSFGLSHELIFEDTDYTIGLSASLGWGDEDHNFAYYGVAEGVFTNLLLAATMNMPFSERLTLVPMVAWSNMVDESIHDRFADSSYFIYGVTASYNF